MSFETRKLTDIEFPMYFSLAPNPGYNKSFLNTRGIPDEWHLFAGQFLNKDNGTWTLRWGTGNHSVEGKLVSLLVKINQLGFCSDKVVQICYQIRQKGEITLIPI